MTEHFVAKREDGRPLWRVLYEHVLEHSEGGSKVDVEFSHEDLKELLRPHELGNYRSAIEMANRKLQKLNKRFLKSDRGRGYILTGGEQQTERAASRQKKAENQFKRGEFELVHTDTELIAQTGGQPALARHDRQLILNGVLLEMCQRNADDIKDHELRLRALERKVGE